MTNTDSIIVDLLETHREQLLTEWIQEQSKVGNRTASLMRDNELRTQCSEFLDLLRQAALVTTFVSSSGPAWNEVRSFLDSISRSRALQGFTPSETATFIFSLKRPLFNLLSKELESDLPALLQKNLSLSSLLDELGLYTTESYQKAREEVIARQQEELLELSTPVVKLWDGVLALPLIGTLDSNRTQIVMESLLQRIVETGSEIAIIDITGVPTVDTLVAQHLIKTVTAARLMGAECIISGIRPQIAQTIVHLGVDLADVETKANLADAFLIALRRMNVSIQRKSNA